MSSVTALVWPRWDWTAFTEHPQEMSALAWVWRRSWNRAPAGKHAKRLAAPGWLRRESFVPQA